MIVKLSDQTNSVVCVSFWDGSVLTAELLVCWKGRI